MAMEIPGKVERNVKDRVASGRTIVTEEMNTVRTAIKDLVALKPVKAVVGLTVDTLDNVGDLVLKNADITRRWISP